MIPLLPIPVTTTRPLLSPHRTTKSTACSKGSAIVPSSRAASASSAAASVRTSSAGFRLSSSFFLEVIGF
jgi:hypothetical protein